MNTGVNKHITKGGMNGQVHTTGVHVPCACVLASPLHIHRL